VRRPGRQSSGLLRAGEDEARAREDHAALRAIYGEVDALLDGWTCDASTECCRFGVTGREPYPTAIEIAELEHAVRARGGLPKRRVLPTVNERGEDERRCALLSDEGKCLVYAARPFGCRTFFCERASGPVGEASRGARVMKGEIARLGRAVADLAERFNPADPGPRPLSNVSAQWRGGARVEGKRRRG